MKNIAEIYPPPAAYPYSGPARVMDTGNGQEGIKVVIDRPEGKQYTPAIPVYPMADNIQTGDMVLVTGNSDEDLYIIGVLNRNPADASSLPEITLNDGAVAAIEHHADGQTLCVYSNKKELIFQYDPQSGQAKISANTGNLVIEAPEGDIALNAAKQIRLSGHSVDINGQSNIGMSVGRIFENIRSSFSLKPGRIDVSGQSMNVSAKQGRLFFNDMETHVKNLVNKVGNARIIAERLETAADAIIENAKNIYRSAEELNQVKAGRMRMLIKSTFHLGSKTAVIKAKDDVKVKGEKIHLG